MLRDTNDSIHDSCRTLAHVISKLSEEFPELLWQEEMDQKAQISEYAETNMLQKSKSAHFRVWCGGAIMKLLHETPASCAGLAN